MATDPWRLRTQVGAPTAAVHVRGGRDLWLWLKAHPMLRVWAISIGVWTGIAVALALTDYLSEAPMGLSNRFASLLALQLSDNLSYIPMTPLAYVVALRYPLQRERWGQRALLLLAVGIAFMLSHVLRGSRLIRRGNPQLKHWERAVTASWAQGLQIHWSVLARCLIGNALLDLIFVYTSIVLIGHAVAYHQGFRQGELRKSQLESQLARARLEALRSQLQPHFLFNTLHSISSLMLTDTRAADRMMTLLSELLRKSLASNASQLVSLAEELQFVDTIRDRDHSLRGASAGGARHSARYARCAGPVSVAAAADRECRTPRRRAHLIGGPHSHRGPSDRTRPGAVHRRQRPGNAGGHGRSPTQRSRTAHDRGAAA